MKDILILYNIRSVYNVGSIFRTADAAGVSKVYLVGVTPAPVDRFGRWRKDFAKVALGAERSVPWEMVKDVRVLIENLKGEDVRVIGIEQSPHSISYRDIPQEKSRALILGSETDGLPQEILDMTDLIAEIPMKGKKESLNVSVVAGIILFCP